MEGGVKIVIAEGMPLEESAPNYTETSCGFIRLYDEKLPYSWPSPKPRPAK